MSKKILLLTYCFPPTNFPEAYLCAKTFLNSKTFDVDIITILPKKEDRDDNFANITSKYFSNVKYISRVKTIEKIINFFLTKWVTALKLPDAHIFYTPYMVREILKIDASKYETVISWSQWHSIHLAYLTARILKPHFKRIKWITKFSDPWSKNTYNNYNFFESFVNTWLERLVVLSADRLVFITKETLDLFLGGYPNSVYNKGIVIPHPFNSRLYPNSEPVEGQIVFRYLGNFYGKRTPDTLLQSLSNYLKKNPVSKISILVEFYGAEYSGLKTLINNFHLEKTVYYKGKVDYLSSLALMKTADVLINIDAPSDHNPFLSSKIIDYLGSMRPVLYIGSTKGTSAQLINDLGLKAFDFYDTEGIQRQIEQYVNQKSQGKIKYKPTPQIYNTYESNNISKRFLNLIKDV